ncbi:hypothetical protein RJT34_12098 [Clitoria ternatea]|uniref:Uncharacterized protein n=1 Tax=Clitoria ternatea TaxID=43366 RepID=A0AAN9JNS1_CLITE
MLSKSGVNGQDFISEVATVEGFLMNMIVICQFCILASGLTIFSASKMAFGLDEQGSSLGMLDVSNAKIFGAALAYVIHGSPSSKCLKVGAVQIYFQKTGVLKMMDPISSLFLKNEKYCHHSSFILSKVVLLIKCEFDSFDFDTVLQAKIWYIIDALGERLSVLIKSFLTAIFVNLI